MTLYWALTIIFYGIPRKREIDMVVCFIGHRKISVEESFKEHLANLIKALISEKDFDTFLFGSRSQFDELCLETVSELKNDYPHIRRIYVRAAYPYIDNYEKYLLSFYDETYIPDKIAKAGKAAYVERNEYMIDKADCCIFYYNENYLPPLKPATRKRIFSFQPKSGTKIAYDYAVQKKKTIINLYSEP